MLVVAPIGVWVALRRDVRIGVATVVGAIGTALFCFLVVIRDLTGTAFRNSWRIPFGGVGGFLKTAFTSPGKLLRYLTSDGRVTYLMQILLPTGGIFFIAPSVALVGSVVLFANIVSTFYYQYQIRSWHSALLPQ